MQKKVVRKESNRWDHIKKIFTNFDRTKKEVEVKCLGCPNFLLTT